MKMLDKKMQEHNENFNQLAINVDLDHLPVGLYHGKMGLCLYFYEFARLTSEKKYCIAADKIFDDTVNSVTEHIEIEPSYIKAGMVNEKFYGWGPEDFELYERLKILGLKIHRSEAFVSSHS